MRVSVLLKGTVAGLAAFLPLGPIAGTNDAATVGYWSKTCIAPNWITGAPETVAEMSVFNPGSQFWAFTSRQPGGHWLIQYNLARINSPATTRAFSIFLFYHECAHAQFNTSDEGVADCQGLAAMRRDVPVSDADIAQISAGDASVGRSFPLASCR